MKGYDIKIRLDHVRPLIWRDLIIPSEITFKDLSDIIQEIFGLLNYHLYSFSFNNETEQIIDTDRYALETDNQIDAKEINIDKYFEKLEDINYIYDFGDGWEFTIEIKKVVDYNNRYPTLKRSKGKYNPIEDCGGPYEFEQILRLKDDPRNSEYCDYKDIIAELEEFDLDSVKSSLEELVL